MLYSDLHKERPPQPFIITVWTVLTDMRKFVKFIGKIVSWSLINKVADCKFATLLKRESPPQQFASKIWEIFQSTCFYRTPPGNKFCINLKYLRKFKPQPTQPPSTMIIIILHYIHILHSSWCDLNCFILICLTTTLVYICRESRFRTTWILRKKTQTICLRNLYSHSEI